MGIARAIGIDSYTTSEAWVLASTDVETPDAKTHTVKIDGRDGVLDFSDSMGLMKYDNRKLTVELDCLSPLWRQEYQAMVRRCHGKRVHIKHPDYDGVFEGRGSIELLSYSAQHASVKITFDCDPYRFIAQMVFRANCAGGVYLVLPCGDRPQIPVFDSEWPLTIAYAGTQYELPSGSNKILDLVLTQGDNTLYIDSYRVPGNTTYENLEAYSFEALATHSYSWWRWRDAPPQARATYTDIEAQSYAALKEATYQEWYWSNADGVVRNVYIQYSMEDI